MRPRMAAAVRSKADTTWETDDRLSSDSALSDQVLAAASTRRSAGSNTRGSSATSAIHVNSTTAVSPRLGCENHHKKRRLKRPIRLFSLRIEGDEAHFGI